MTVYVVMYRSYEGDAIEAICATREKAEAEIVLGEIDDPCVGVGQSRDIQEHEVLE